MKRSWADIFYDRCVLVGGYKDIRPDIIDLFAELYNQPEVEEYRSRVDSSQLRQQAISAHNIAPDYTPAEPLFQLKALVQQVWTLLRVVLLMVFVLSSLLAHEALSRISLEALSAIDAILSLSIFPPLIMALIILYVYAISANKTITQRFNEDLVIPPAVVNESARNESRLFAYYVWNRSLNGAKMHVGLSILYLLKTVRPSFYEFVLRAMVENADVFLSGRGKISIVRELYRRERSANSSVST